LADSDLSAGDFVRWTKQVIDLLGQIAVVGDTEMANRARASAKLLDRGVVAYSSLA
jgi:ATP-dependent RNA helicase HelY